MLIDVSRPTLHVLVDECPLSVVLRTLAREGEAVQGIVQQYTDPANGKGQPTWKSEVRTLPATVSAVRAGLVIRETRLPIESVLRNPYGADKRFASLEIFEAASLRQTAKEILLWRVQVRINRPKDKWLVSVFDAGTNEELAAFTAMKLRAGAQDALPLERLNMKTAAIEVPVRKPDVDNRWTRLLDNEDES